MHYLRIFILFLVPFGAGFADQVIPEGNFGPLYLYPDNPEDRLYKLPWAAGKRFRTNDSYFSEPGSSHHPDYAIDFAISDGEPILAVRAGKVTVIRNADTICNIPTSLGNTVMVSRLDSFPDTTSFRANGYRLTRTEDMYLHVRNDILVKIGDPVEQGQVIAYISCTGQDGGGPHLHFEVNMAGHEGGFPSGDSIYTFTSIPSPWVEVTDHPNGLTEEGDFLTSQNVPLPIANEGDKKSRELKNPLQVWPNPFQDRSQIFFRTRASEPFRLKVFDTRGKLIKDFGAKQSPWPWQKLTWDTRSVTPGVYLLSLRVGNKQFVKKVLRLP